MKALVIEDSEDERDILCDYLRSLGFDTMVERSTLKAAIETLNKEKFDLITLDLRLQDSTPETTLASLPVIASYAGNTPVLVVTGHTSFIAPCVAKYAQGLLAKPYGFRDFGKAVESAITSNKYRPLFPVAMLFLSQLKGFKPQPA